MDPHISVADLRRAIEIKEKIEALESQLSRLLAGRKPSGPSLKAPKPSTDGPKKKRRPMSPEGRARIAAGAKARWDRIRAGKATQSTATPQDAGTLGGGK